MFSGDPSFISIWANGKYPFWYENLNYSTSSVNWGEKKKHKTKQHA